MSVRAQRGARSGRASLFEVVLEDEMPPTKGAKWLVPALAWSVALGAHAGLWLAASGTEPSLEVWSARLAAQIHDDLSAQASIAIEPTPAVEPDPELEPEPEPELEPEPEPEAPRAVRDRTPAEGAPELAQTAAIVAAEPELAGPVDLTDNTFVTGTARTFAGGVSASEGTSDRAVTQVPSAAEVAPRPAPIGPSQARRVQLAPGAWRCAWPNAAVAQDIYEQHVVLRVVVRVDGSVAQARVVSDPGHGFGQAAVACARQTRFVPARDVNGEPVEANSPPIRVRFTR